MKEMWTIIIHLQLHQLELNTHMLFIALQVNQTCGYLVRGVLCAHSPYMIIQ